MTSAVWLVMMSKKTFMPARGRRRSARQVGVGAEVRVDLGEVGDPVAVVAGARVRRVPCTGLFLNDGRQPDRVVPRPLM
jgi:hypothetical protein